MDDVARVAAHGVAHLSVAAPVSRREAGHRRGVLIDEIVDTGRELLMTVGAGRT